MNIDLSKFTSSEQIKGAIQYSEMMGEDTTALRKRLAELEKEEHYDFRLRINTRIDLPEEEIEDTIIHEMIHYFIEVNKMEDSSAHGPLFLHMMNTINEKFGRHLTVSRKAS